jgi:hypothetical protein
MASVSLGSACAMRAGTHTTAQGARQGSHTQRVGPALGVHVDVVAHTCIHQSLFAADDIAARPFIITAAAHLGSAAKGGQSLRLLGKLMSLLSLCCAAGEHVRQKPWLQPVTRDPPSAADPQRRPFRKRPFIYV